MGLRAQGDDSAQGIPDGRQVRDGHRTTSSTDATTTAQSQRQVVTALGSGNGFDQHQTSIATLAADGLGEDTHRIRFLGADAAGISDDDFAARGTLATRATHQYRRASGRGGTSRQNRVNGHAALAATTPDTLRQHAVRTNATRNDDAAVVYLDKAAGHANAAIAAQQNIDALVTRLNAATPSKAARTATTADGLGQNTDGPLAEGLHLGRSGHTNFTAVATSATRTAHGELRTGRNASHIGRPAVSATTTNALREDGVRILTGRAYQATRAQDDIARVAADTAFKPDGHTESVGGNRVVRVGGRKFSGHRRGTAIATTVADGLREQTEGVATEGPDFATRIQRDVTANTTRTAIATNGDTSFAAVGRHQP